MPGQCIPSIRFVNPPLTGHISFAGQHRMHRIHPQTVMVIEIFVPQSQPKNPLTQQLIKSMLNVGGMTRVAEALLQSPDHSDLRLRLSENQTHLPTFSAKSRTHPSTSVTRHLQMEAVDLFPELSNWG